MKQNVVFHRVPERSPSLSLALAQVPGSVRATDVDFGVVPDCPENVSVAGTSYAGGPDGYLPENDHAGTLTRNVMESWVKWDANGDITRDSWGNHYNSLYFDRTDVRYEIYSFDPNQTHYVLRTQIRHPFPAKSGEPEE